MSLAIALQLLVALAISAAFVALFLRIRHARSRPVIGVARARRQIFRRRR